MEKRTGNTPADVVSENAEEVNSQKEKIRGIRRPLDSEVLRMIQEAEHDIDGFTTAMAVSLAHITFNIAKRRLAGTLDPATEIAYGEAMGRRIIGAKRMGIPLKAIMRGQIIVNRIIHNYMQSSLNNKQ